MDENPRRYRNLLALVWLPLALAIVVPVVVLLGLSFYVRALATGLFTLVRSLLGYQTPPPPPESTQPPHIFDVPKPALKSQTKE